MNRAARRAKQRARQAAKPQRLSITRTIAEENAIARANGMPEDPFVVIQQPEIDDLIRFGTVWYEITEAGRRHVPYTDTRLAPDVKVEHIDPYPDAPDPRDPGDGTYKPSENSLIRTRLISREEYERDWAPHNIATPQEKR